MDPITHAALGASCAQVVFGKYNKSIPWQVGAISAMAPDLDIFIRFSNDPLSYEYWHRNFTHAFLFIPIGGLLVGLFFLCFVSYRKHGKITLGAALIGYSTHGMLDAMTAYGTLLLWPWSYNRISWDIISIVNPLFTIPLIVCLAWSVLYKKPKIAWLGLLFVSSLLLFKSIHHYEVLNSARAFAKKNKLSLTKIRAMPDIASSHWRIIAKNNNCLLVADAKTSLLNGSRITPITQLPLYSKNLTSNFSSTQQKELTLFSWFSDGYMVVANNNPLILGDGRYTFGTKPLYSLWGIKVLPQEKNVISLSYILSRISCPTEVVSILDSHAHMIQSRK